MARVLCEACERGDHTDCGMQTWCQCECDPSNPDSYTPPDPDDYEGEVDFVGSADSGETAK